MAITLATTPAYAVPGAKVRVTTSAGAGGDYARLYITDAPSGSAWKLKLAEAGATRLQVHEGEAGRSFDFIGDRPGGYVFFAEEITRNDAAATGGYAGAAANTPSETVVGTSTTTLYLGQRLTAPVGTPADGRAEFVLWVWNDTIRATTLEQHGETTPALRPLDANPTPRMRAAALSTGVQTALAALANVTVTTALGAADSVLIDIIGKLKIHAASVTFHANADTDNSWNDDATWQVFQGVGTYATAQSLAAATRDIVVNLSRHVVNDSGTGAGSGDYHEIAAVASADWANVPSPAPGSADVMGQLMAVADAWAAFESHRVSTASHLVADTSALTALPPLLDVLRYFSASLRSSNPTAPAVENPGALLLAAAAGMKEG